MDILYGPGCLPEPKMWDIFCDKLNIHSYHTIFFITLVFFEVMSPRMDFYSLQLITWPCKKMNKSNMGTSSAIVKKSKDLYIISTSIKRQRSTTKIGPFCPTIPPKKGPPSHSNNFTYVLSLIGCLFPCFLECESGSFL